jgi:hypothetical protein
MTTKTLLSLATVSLLALTAQATTYSVDERTVWFDENIASAEETLDPEDGDYSATPTYAVEGDTDNRYISLDTAANSPLLFTPSGALPTGASTYLFEVTIKSLTLCASTPTVSGTPVASIAAVAGTPSNKWYGWDGNSWEDLSSGIATAPAEGRSYNIAIELYLDGSNENKLTIKYTVGSESKTLVHSSEEDSLPSLTKVGFAGYSQFQNFSGSGVKSTFSVTTTKTEDQLKAAGLDVAAGQTVAQALNSTGSNGLPQWQSLALGISPSTTTKPYTAPVQTNNGTLGFTIGNYGTPSVNGNVTFDVYECNAQGVISGSRVGYANAGSTAEVTAPTANAGVKYYKIKIKFQ